MPISRANLRRYDEAMGIWRRRELEKKSFFIKGTGEWGGVLLICSVSHFKLACNYMYYDWYNKMIPNILTIDLEDFYSASSVTYDNLKLSEAISETEGDRLWRETSTILDVLEENGVSATFFVVGYLGEKYPDLIDAIHIRGHHIGSHGYRHQLVHRMSKTEFDNDLKKSVRVLQKATNDEINAFRAPVWSYLAKKCEWFWEVLSENGIKYDSSIFPTKNFMYGEYGASRFINIRTFNIIEIPPSTFRFFNVNLPFSGGFYLRACPYWFIRALTRHINAAGYPVIAYFHPYEVDTRLEKIRGQTIVNNFINHFNIGTTMRKIESLLRDFEFFSIKEYFQRSVSYDV